MKNNIKLISLIGGTLIIVGLIVSTLAFSFMGFNVDRLNTEKDFKEELKTYNATDINQINVDVRNRSIDIKKTNQNNIVVKYKTNEKNAIYCEKSNGSVNVSSEDIDNWLDQLKHGAFINFSFNFTDNLNIQIEIPMNFKGELIIHTSNASINLSDISNLSNIDLQTSNSNIIIENVECENARIMSSNGAIDLTNLNVNNKIDGRTSNNTIEIKNCKSSEIEFKTSNGKIILYNINTTRSLEATTSNAKITVERIICPEIKLKSSNSNIELDYITATKIIDATTSSGEITINRIIGNAVKLKSSNGGIKGTIIGEESEYSIDNDTSNSSCTPSNREGSTDKTLNADTSNGKINIRFVK